MTPPPRAPANALGLDDPAFAELIEAARAGSLILCAGPGVSTAAGLPGRARLLEVLLQHARARGASAEALGEIEDLAGRGQLIEALSAAKAALGEGEFGVVVRRELNRQASSLPEIATAIAALGPKLRAVLTTNLDHLLERALGGTFPVLPRATGDLAQQQQFILKLHGTLLDRSTWVLTSDDHARALYADPALQGVFGALFRTCHLLFVGFDPAEEDLTRVLAPVSAAGSDPAPRHFALVPAGTATPHRRKRLEQAGVRLILYEGTATNPDEEARLLRALAERAGVAVEPEPPPPPPPSTQPPPGVRRRVGILAELVAGGVIAALFYVQWRTPTAPVGTPSALRPDPPPILASASNTAVPELAASSTPSAAVSVRPVVTSSQKPLTSPAKRDAGTHDAQDPLPATTASASTVFSGNATCKGTVCSLSPDGGGALGDAVRVCLDAPASAAGLFGVQPVCTLSRSGSLSCSRSDKAADVPLTPPIRFRPCP